MNNKEKEKQYCERMETILGLIAAERGLRRGVFTEFNEQEVQRLRAERKERRAEQTTIQ